MLRTLSELIRIKSNYFSTTSNMAPSDAEMEGSLTADSSQLSELNSALFPRSGSPDSLVATKASRSNG
jgi:hypothetical protein